MQKDSGNPPYNIAMENGPFEGVFPTWAFSMATLVDQNVYQARLLLAL